MNVAKKRGRQATLSVDEIERIIIAHAEDIIVNDNVVSKTNNVWEQMASETNHRKGANGFYSHVTCDRNFIKTRLLKNRIGSDLSEKSDDSVDASFEDCEPENNSKTSSDGQDSLVETKTEVVRIKFTHKEFQDLLVEKSYSRHEKDRPQLRNREYTVLKPSVWQQVVTEKLWKKKISHGFQFKTHKVSLETNTAYFIGHCKCGSKITGTFEDITCDSIDVTCNITPGIHNGPCGKRFCRAPERAVIGAILTDKNKAVSAYRAERADDLMEMGDKEPPQLYNSNVLRVVKGQFKQAGRVHKEVKAALEILQLSDLADVIQSYGLKPFFIHYWTHYQIDVFRQYSRDVGASCISLDATGSIVKPIYRCDKSKSRVIYLYECVVHTEAFQFSVAQMITEAHNTNNIQFWLMEWLKSGAPCPREVVVDSSLALLAATVRAFTNMKSIDAYADACSEIALPNCYIRIDVAHFIKMYADFLKGCRPRIKRFLLASIGQIILSTSKVEVEERLTWLLTVTRSETEGMIDDRETLCEKRKRCLQQLITGGHGDHIESILDSTEDDQCGQERLVCDEERNNKEELPNIQTVDDSSSNYWKKWAEQIDNKVKATISDENGDRENAHFLPRLADRIVKDAKWIPLWSCVSQKKFGYGRIPASSASVESEFNHLKNRVFKNESLPIRADDFISKHVRYLNGRSKLIEAANVLSDKNQSCPDEENGIDRDADDKGHCPLPRTEKIPYVKNARASRQEKLLDEAADFTHNLALANSSMMESPQPRPPTITAVEKFSKDTCIPCSKKNFPSGAHTCVFCRRAVHVLPGCSVAAEEQEEGYGENRICVECNTHHRESAKDTATANLFENWGGFAGKESKRARYLFPRFQDHELLLHKNLVKVPLLKNGNTLSLRPVSIGKKKVTLSNTCGFDSILQVFLSAALDYKDFLEVCKSTSNSFLALVYRIAQKGILGSTYVERAKILSSLCSVLQSKFGVDLIDCQFTVGGLCIKLLKEVPSLTEVLRCTKRCPERQVILPRIQIEKDCLLNVATLTSAIETSMQLKNRPCGKIGCLSEVEVDIKTGPYLILEISNTNSKMNNKVQLSTIPTSLQLSFSEDKFDLVGLIHFTPPPSTRGSAEERPIGHYVGISQRPDKSWVLYDDTKNDGVSLTDKFMTLVEMLIYLKK